MDGAARRVAGHLAPLEDVARIAEHLGDERGQREAANEHHALLAQRRKDPVALFDDEPRRDRDGLLPVRGAIEPDPTLPLEDDHAGVEDAQPAHLPVGPQQRLRRQKGIAGRVRAAVVAQHAKERDVGIVVAERLEGHRGRNRL